MKPIVSAALATALIASCARDAREPTLPRPAPAPAQEPAQHAHVADQRATEATAFLDPGAEGARRPVREALAVMYSTSGLRMGTVRFVDTDGAGLAVSASVDSLPIGAHAYHVHVYGDCSSADFKSAGPHFHFTGSSHDEHVNMITGNLGELAPDAEGRAQAEARLPDARLQGPFSVMGRAVIVHAQGNDPAVTPDGGAGARIACGVIGIANPERVNQAAAR
jgi:Cu-Zn family superoxide dismutase